MTAEERAKVRDWARRNLGKEVTYLHEVMFGLQERHEVMVVGYSELSAQVTGEEKVDVLVSYTDYHGWGPEALDGTDHVLVHSPLNVSFLLVYPGNIEEYVVDEYFDKRHAEQE